MERLIALGYNEQWQARFAQTAPQGTVPMRVTAVHLGSYELSDGTRASRAGLPGKLRFGAYNYEDFPTVGDWVAAREVPGSFQILSILPRDTLIRRIDAFHADMQSLAANVDVVLLVQSLNRDFSVNRLQRYMAVAHESGASPVVVMTKCDMYDDSREMIDQIAQRLPPLPILRTSAYTGEGIDMLRDAVPRGATAVALGSSGVGKSSLLNALCGSEVMKVSEIRADDDMGRHTTRHRQLIELPWGGLFIDTPGLREVAGSDSDASGMFAQILDLAQNCEFHNCTHVHEPGCAVLDALHRGELLSSQLKNFRNLQQDERYASRVMSMHAKRVKKQQNARRGIHYRNARRGAYDDTVWDD